MHRVQDAVFQKIGEHRAIGVNCTAGGGVVHGVVFCMGFVAHVSGHKRGQILADQILTNYDHGHTSRAHVLLYTCPNHAIVINIAWTRKEHGGLVRHQNLAICVWQLKEGCAIDGMIIYKLDDPSRESFS